MQVGTKAGHYEILALLGVAEVYRARAKGSIM